ncbi:MAG: 50S ribosomal protein L35 [Candidatus Coprovivens sp.]
MGKCKQKTHKASSKVLKAKKNGQLVYKKSNGNHITGKDTAKAVRQRRRKGVLADGMARRLKDFI